MSKELFLIERRGTLTNSTQEWSKVTYLSMPGKSTPVYFKAGNGQYRIVLVERRRQTPDRRQGDQP